MTYDIDLKGKTALVTAAGQGIGLASVKAVANDGLILECSEEDWDFAFALNTKAMYQLCKLVLPAMIKNDGGSIINMSSVAASVKGVPNRFAYCASKAAVIGLTKSIAADLSPKGSGATRSLPARSIALYLANSASAFTTG